MSKREGRPLLVADIVWISTALLTRENPDREHFSVEEIVKRGLSEGLPGAERPGVQAHAYLHCIANKPPNPGNYRMLFATGKNTRRLFLSGDIAHPLRKGKIMPRPSEIPSRYIELLQWYERTSANFKGRQAKVVDPILALRGMGTEIWANEDADAYVQRLREGWS